MAHKLISRLCLSQDDSLRVEELMERLDDARSPHGVALTALRVGLRALLATQSLREAQVACLAADDA